jgi:hypothetical protein
MHVRPSRSGNRLIWTRCNRILLGLTMWDSKMVGLAMYFHDYATNYIFQERKKKDHVAYLGNDPSIDNVEPLDILNFISSSAYLKMTFSPGSDGYFFVA